MLENIGDKGTDSITINKDGTFEFKRAFTKDSFTENNYVKGQVITNNSYLVLVELYDFYDEEMTPPAHSYYFYIEDDSLKLVFDDDFSTDSTVFKKIN